MNQNVTENKRTLKFRIPIIILVSFSLICAAVGFIQCFFDYVRVSDYNYAYNYEDYYEYEENYYDDWNRETPYHYELEPWPPDFFEGFMTVIPPMIPIVLLLLYASFLYRRPKADIIVPLVFVLTLIIIFWFYIFYEELLVLHCVAALICVCCMICTLTGFGKNYFLAAAMAVALLSEAIATISVFGDFSYYAEQGWDMYIYCDTALILGVISFFVSLLLLVLNQNLPAVIKRAENKRVFDGNDPAQVLNLLKEKHELGIITDEEYQAQRSEIISKL